MAGDKDIVGCYAHLARVSAFSPKQTASSELEVATGVDVDRVLASQLKTYMLMIVQGENV